MDIKRARKKLFKSEPIKMEPNGIIKLNPPYSLARYMYILLMLVSWAFAQVG